MKIRVLITTAALTFGALACNAPTSVQESITTATVSANTVVATRYAAGTKAIKINTHDLTGGSFTVPSILPAPTPVPVGFPGYDGVTQYRQGISAANYYDVDGTTAVSKPSWLLDFQLGLTGLPGTPNTCATFGGSGNADVSGYYRTSEIDCSAANTIGTGSNINDRAYMRIVLNRDLTVLGSAENLLVQIEYQASGLRLNSDGIDPLPENNLDQLWKIFWNTSLGSTTPNVFSVFVPPNYAACLPNGTGSGGGTAGGPGTCVNGYKGAPISVKQIIIPISAYPTLSVIHLARMKGRINHADTFPTTNPVNYVAPFFSSGTSSDCQADSPLCMGVVIRSILLMRM